MLWMLPAFLAWSISHNRKHPVLTAVWYWRGLALLFMFLSADEAASIHETVGILIEQRLYETKPGFFHYGWVFYGIAFVAIIAAVFSRFLFSLPRRTILLFICSGGVFLSGALGVEMTGAALESNAVQLSFLHGRDYWRIVAEESLEMLGLILLSYALVRYMETEHLAVSLLRKRGGDGSPANMTH